MFQDYINLKREISTLRTSIYDKLGEYRSMINEYRSKFKSKVDFEIYKKEVDSLYSEFTRLEMRFTDPPKTILEEFITKIEYRINEFETKKYNFEKKKEFINAIIIITREKIEKLKTTEVLKRELEDSFNNIQQIVLDLPNYDITYNITDIYKRVNNGARNIVERVLQLEQDNVNSIQSYRMNTIIYGIVIGLIEIVGFYMLSIFTGITVSIQTRHYFRYFNVFLIIYRLYQLLCMMISGIYNHNISNIILEKLRYLFSLFSLSSVNIVISSFGIGQNILNLILPRQIKEIIQSYTGMRFDSGIFNEDINQTSIRMIEYYKKSKKKKSKKKKSKKKSRSKNKIDYLKLRFKK